MSNITSKKQKSQEGITLLITIILMGVLLSVGTALLNVTLKQFQLAGIMLESEIAFQAANAAMECARANDVVGRTSFAVPNKDENLKSITCMEDLSNDTAGGNLGVTEDDDDDDSVGSPGRGIVDQQGEMQIFSFDWGIDGQEVCSRIIMRKYFDPSAPVTQNLEGVVAGRVCSQNTECTIAQARGYNVACDDLDNGGRVVEREFTLVY